MKVDETGLSSIRHAVDLVRQSAPRRNIALYSRNLKQFVHGANIIYLFRDRTLQRSREVDRQLTPDKEMSEFFHLTEKHIRHDKDLLSILPHRSYYKQQPAKSGDFSALPVP